MVMPLYDDNPFRLPHRPIVTWSLIGVNFLVFLAEIGGSNNSGEMVCHFGLTPGALFGDGASLERSRRASPSSVICSCIPTWCTSSAT